jgi:SP family xylose:H+ symportor-like MFS transporter
MIVTQANAGPSGEGSYRAGYVWTIAFVAALGGLLFGYDWVVIGGAKPFFEPYFGLSKEYGSGWANSCAIVGYFLGAIVAGALSDRFGRKILLILSAVLCAVTSLGTGLAETFTSFVAWRISGGVAIGLASNLSPMYSRRWLPPARADGSSP